MTTSLELDGKLISPAPGAGIPCQHGVSRLLDFEFDPIRKEYAEVLSVSDYVVAAEATEWSVFELAQVLTSVELLAFSPVVGLPAVTFELLLGAKPVVSGVSGTFPTGFSGGETFDFDLVDDGTATSIAVTFTSGAQTAAQVANEINAAAALAGFGPVASAATEVTLTGPKPGSNQQIVVTTANAQIGFASTGTTAGTGSAVTVAGVFLLETETPGADVWVRGGPATVNALVAGG